MAQARADHVQRLRPESWEAQPKFFRRLFPTAGEQPELTIRGAGHFLQEEKGAEIAAEVLAFMERTRP